LIYNAVMKRSLKVKYFDDLLYIARDGIYSFKDGKIYVEVSNFLPLEPQPLEFPSSFGEWQSPTTPNNSPGGVLADLTLSKDRR
jgi:hypothetical protein